MGSILDGSGKRLPQTVYHPALAFGRASLSGRRWRIGPSPRRTEGWAAGESGREPRGEALLFPGFFSGLKATCSSDGRFGVWGFPPIPQESRHGWRSPGTGARQRSRRAAESLLLNTRPQVDSQVDSKVQGSRRRLLGLDLWFPTFATGKRRKDGARGVAVLSIAYPTADAFSDSRTAIHRPR